MRLITSLFAFAVIFSACAKESITEINADHVVVINGKKVFPIGFTMPPPPDGKTPEGKNAIQELADAGANFMRTGAWGGKWDDSTIAIEKKYEDAAARYGMHCLPYLRELSEVKPGDRAQEQRLARIVKLFRNHPGLGAWKGADEPEWGKVHVEPLIKAREVIHQYDPHHPVVIIQAPRGTVETLRPYNDTCEITGADVYPISYPPGIHSLLTNKEISMVGDYTRTMTSAANSNKPVWMVLQIAWSGVVKPGKTLRFPTFPEERFMTYEAIINGARGLLYFGGNVDHALGADDQKLGWNWHFWRRVLRPVIEEIGDKSPLHAALVAPNSQMPLQVKGSGMEFCVREVGNEIYVLACKRDHVTEQVEFEGLPVDAVGGEVMYEQPRSVKVHDGKFTDWFAPFEVHVYHFRKS